LGQRTAGGLRLRFSSACSRFFENNLVEATSIFTLKRETISSFSMAARRRNGQQEIGDQASQSRLSSFTRVLGACRGFSAWITVKGQKCRRWNSASAFRSAGGTRISRDNLILDERLHPKSPFLLSLTVEAMQPLTADHLPISPADSA